MSSVWQHFCWGFAQTEEKVILHDKEKAFIRSLGDIDAWDWETINASPPLLGPDRAQRYDQMTSPQVAAWGPKRKQEGRPHAGAREAQGDRGIRPIRDPNLQQPHVLWLRLRDPFKVHDQEAGGATVCEIWFYVSLRPGLTNFLMKASALYEALNSCGRLDGLWKVVC